jgi:hypothetical protein
MDFEMNPETHNYEFYYADVIKGESIDSMIEKFLHHMATMNENIRVKWFRRTKYSDSHNCDESTHEVVKAESDHCLDSTSDYVISDELKNKIAELKTDPNYMCNGSIDLPHGSSDPCDSASTKAGNYDSQDDDCIDDGVDDYVAEESKALNQSDENLKHADDKDYSGNISKEYDRIRSMLINSFWRD